MWFSPEREALQAAIDKTQEFCTGTHQSTALCVQMPVGGEHVYFFIKDCNLHVLCVLLL